MATETTAQENPTWYADFMAKWRTMSLAEKQAMHAETMKGEWL